MKINPAEISIKEMYGHLVNLITPRPIAWVSTVSSEGVNNLAPYSFFNGVSANPPAVCFSPVNTRDGEKKDTVLNIEATRQFVINVVPAALAEKMNQTSFEYDSTEDEIAAVGLTPLASEMVAPPRVAESPIQLECELIQIVNLGEGPLAPHLAIGRILLAHIADEVIVDGKVSSEKLDLVGRMGGAEYCYTRQKFEMSRPTSR